MPIARDRRLPPVCRVAELRGIEGRAKSEPLMERAGLAAAEIARSLLAGRSGPVVVLAGPGNNGGDGLVVARWLRGWFYDVAVVFRGDAAALPSDGANAFATFVAAGGTTVVAPPRERPALVVDALFGIGLGRPLAPEYAELAHWANAQDAPVLAVDIPTGLNADTGIATAPVIRATATATFIALKPGLLTAEGPDLCGVVSVHALGLDVEALAPQPGHALAWAALATALPEVLLRRTRGVHKGTFGTLGVIGGARGMTGALLLAGRAAVRSGAGKVRLGFIDAVHPGVDPSMPELMLDDASGVFARGADAWVAGCGLGTGSEAQELLRGLISSTVPLALDADALTLLGDDATLRAAVRARNAATLVTPHPAEAARLLGTTVAGIQHDRLAAALAIARELRAHVVLKGVGSVLGHPDGRWAVNTSGNPALATAGSGDALAGMLGALLAQRVAPMEALRLAVCLHGAAADALVARGVGPLGVGASELADAARELVNRAARAAG